MKAVKPRLHVLLARDAPVGVVLRRGPTRQVAAIAWDRKRDRFDLGQWLKGRIYELRSDIAPDGKHWIYFAMNGHWGSETKGSWTAVARTPYLRALALYAKGDCWNGGGLFAEREYWINDGYGHKVLTETREVKRADRTAYRPTWGGECWGVYFLRLERDGWRLREDLSMSTRGSQAMVWEKGLSGGWALRKVTYAGYRRAGQSIYNESHELVGPDGREHIRDDWEWADRDRNRLVWAADGALWTGEPDGEPRLLYDFAPMKFAEIRAPYADEGKNKRRRSSPS